MDWEPHDRHWIRLRGPWDAVRLNGEGNEVWSGRLSLPRDWHAFCRDGDEDGGVARFTRRFQRPTQLDPDERVVITLTNVNTDVVATLNGWPTPPLPTPLGDPECWPAQSCLSYDVTDRLEASNELNLQLQLPRPQQSAHVGLHEPVLLEIVSVDEPGESSG